MGLCDSSGLLYVFLIMKIVISIVCVLVPIIVMFMVFKDVFASVIKGDSKEAINILQMNAKRLVAGLIIFLIPSGINFAFSLVNADMNSISACYKEASLQKINSLKMSEKAKLEEERKKEKEKLDNEFNKRNENDKKENEERRKEKENNNQNNGISTNNSNNSTNGDFYYTESTGTNSNYKGHAVDLTDAQKLKVARALMGERSNADLGTYIVLCQYIRDYIDYGNVTSRTYDSIGSSWLLSAGHSRTDYPISWYESNRPYVMEAIDYVFNKGGSAFQGKVTFYIDNADYGSGNENNDSAIKSEINSWMHNENLAAEHGKYMDEHQIIYGEYTGGNRSVWVVCKTGCQSRANLKAIKG